MYWFMGLWVAGLWVVRQIVSDGRTKKRICDGAGWQGAMFNTNPHHTLLHQGESS